MTDIVNIAAYKFTELDDAALPAMQTELKTYCRELGLRGSILLSREGINLSIAGTRQQVDTFWSHITSIDSFCDLTAKESYSEDQPFQRMLVKIKESIIPLDAPQLASGKTGGPSVDPRVLKRWLDEGKEVVLVDTRNEYEVAVGTFENALNLHIKSFREFPTAVEKLDDSFREKPMVIFCTGGIRCEKALPFMRESGFKYVYQLSGGILKYFETCGDSHYDGDCFVFDKRVAVNGKLEDRRHAYPDKTC